MRETAEDLEALQALIDASYARAGRHLREIHTDATRVDARRLVRELEGMNVLVVATVTADRRPLTGPVDGLFYRGRFHFGTSPEAVRARHLRRSPWVSATHVRGEELVVTAHGRARELGRRPGDRSGFWDLCREVYGPDWDSWDARAPYWVIEADRLFAADTSVLGS